MTDEFHPKNIVQEVLTKIKEDKVKMKSRSHFMLRNILYILGGLVAAAALVYLLSFILFVLRIQGAWHLTTFGLRGLSAFFLSFPWILVFIATVFWIGLELLVKKTKVGYRKPIVYSVLSLVVLSIGVGYIFAELPVHKLILERAEEGSFPIMGPLYKNFNRQPLHQAYRGEITEMYENGFLIVDINGQEFKVNLNEETRFPYTHVFVVGDDVIIMGELENEIINAFGVHPIDSDDFFMPHHPKQPMMHIPMRKGMIIFE